MPLELPYHRRYCSILTRWIRNAYRLRRRNGRKVRLQSNSISDPEPECPAGSPSRARDAAFMMAMSIRDLRQQPALGR